MPFLNTASTAPESNWDKVRPDVSTNNARPGRRVVGVLGAVLAGVDVESLVATTWAESWGFGQKPVIARPRRRRRSPPGTAFAEVVLYVDDDKCPHTSTL